ncbi:MULTISPECIES: MEDS domain-containing protein [unclassified Priestia]|uniref:MEDS domain-containing protein n=1 Tax=unclassified Priestia TaxID=2800374 RepID=UPI0036704133
MKNQFAQLIENNKSVHIYYNIDDMRSYVDNLVSYIVSGVEQERHTLVIESERLIPLIFKRLEGILTKDQLTYIHTINNFDYYCSSGSFQPAIIFEHLSKHLDPFYKNNTSFQIWAHVEWGQQEGIIPILEEFENEADTLVTEGGLYLVCAYDEERVPEALKLALMKCHPYLILENKIRSSDLYIMTGAV